MGRMLQAVAPITHPDEERVLQDTLRSGGRSRSIGHALSAPTTPTRGGDYRYATFFRLWYTALRAGAAAAAPFGAGHCDWKP
jgi:hypothetical protein